MCLCVREKEQEMVTQNIIMKNKGLQVQNAVAATYEKPCRWNIYIQQTMNWCVYCKSSEVTLTANKPI